MTISTELESHILRYYHAEKWKVGTIASHLHVHRSVVERVLSKTGVAESTYRKQPSMMDAYLPFILQTLEKFPTLTASRLYHMVRGRGYPGQESHFRHMIALYRPRKASEAYLRLKTLPGEQSQIDWGLCRARHNPHYADHYAMPSCYLKFLISSIIQQNIA